MILIFPIFVVVVVDDDWNVRRNATIFLLIVQSETVISLCLNVGALSFVWNIDDMFYTLGRSGYFLVEIQESTNHNPTEASKSNKECLQRCLLLHHVYNGWPVGKKNC